MGITDIMRRDVTHVRASLENPAVPLNSPELLRLLGGEPSWTGVQVNVDKALTWVAMHACVKVLAESFAQLPAAVFERQEVGRRRAFEHWLYYLLDDQANSEMTSFEWREIGMYHLGFKGNYYSEIEWTNSQDRVLGFWPLRPDRTEPVRIDGEIFYKTYVRKSINSPLQPKLLPAYRVLHIPGAGFDGLKGMDPLVALKQAVGRGLALEEYAARVFSNGAAPRIVLKYPTKVGSESRKALRHEFEVLYGGLENSHRTALLEEGITIEKLTWNPAEVQALETRTFELREVCRFFRVPAHMVNDLERSTNNNIEHQGLEFVMFTMAPWNARWEKRCKRLVNLAETRGNEVARSRFYVKFNVDSLQRGDFRTRMEGHQIAIQNGLRNPDECRELEDENPREDGLGGRYLVPANMMFAETMAAEPDGGEKRAAALRKKDPQNPQALARERYRHNYEGLLAAVYGDLVRNEVAALGKMLDRAETEGLATVRPAMEKFYGGLEQKAEHRLVPTMAGLAGLIAETVATTLSLDSTFLAEYASAAARRYTEASMQQILHAAASEGNAIDSMRALLDDWASSRAASEALNESTRAVECFAAEAMKEATCTTEF